MKLFIEVLARRLSPTWRNSNTAQSRRRRRRWGMGILETAQHCPASVLDGCRMTSKHLKWTAFSRKFLHSFLLCTALYRARFTDAYQYHTNRIVSGSRNYTNRMVNKRLTEGLHCCCEDVNFDHQNRSPHSYNHVPLYVAA